MVRIWESVLLTGLFILTFVLVILLYRPTPSLRGAFINIDTHLTGGSGKVSVAKLKISLNEQQHLDGFPYQIGDRQGTDDEEVEYLKKILKADTLLLRMYTSDSFRQPIFLLIIHSPRSNSFHPPRVCYRGQGYSIEEESKDAIYVKDTALKKRIEEPSWDTLGEWFSVKFGIPVYPAEIPVNKLIVYKTDKNETVERRLVYYLYLKDLEFTSHEFSMLRVSALIPVNGHYDDVEREMKDFMSEVLALIFEDYGEERERVISIIVGLGPKGYFILAALFVVPLAMIIYPLAARKVFTPGKDEEVMEKESENAGKTLGQLEAGIDKIDETKTAEQPLSLPFNLAEKTGKDRILAAYYNSQWIIEKATGVNSASCPTLRDFLNKVIPVLPAKAADHFAELTRMAEVTMYSVSAEDESTVTRACYLADKIIKELYTTSIEPQ
ncbi:exosortase-associated EpsI family protein [Chloroflexota bacterium]